MITKRSTFFKAYIYVSLFLIVILLAILTGSIIYGALKIRDESKTVSTKVNSFTNNLNTVNTNLQNINKQLQEQNSSLSTKGLSAL